MNTGRLLKQVLFAQLPPPWEEDLLPAIQARVRQSGRKVIVLDDDPTGTQTVHDVPVLTKWSVERLAGALNGPEPAAYLLTNSRSLPLDEAQALNGEIGRNLHQAGQQTGRGYAVVSRSDSTLRGHFPGEVAALAEGLETRFDAWLIVPFFEEGGRYTIEDVHYAAEGDWLVPVGETEFARDKVFGYRSSNLRDWVVEKTGGAVTSDRVASISLTDLRQGGPDAVLHRLLDLPRGAVCIANAASYRDLEVLVLALLDAEARGWRFLYRTAASFVRVRAGIAPQPLLTAASLDLRPGGAGLIVAGSYVPRTSAQLEELFQGGLAEPVEIQVNYLLDEAARAGEIRRASEKVNALVAAGRDTALYTSRALISQEDAEKNLSIGQTISASLVAVVRGLQTRPRYLLAKGGITSSDIATQGLGIQQAAVLGQILPGVPVWRCGPESKFPGLAYVVFPGNVGKPEALAQIIRALREPAA